MLDNNTIRQIEEFVIIKPRSIQEIAIHLEKNWRTIDRYISEIRKEFGTLDTRTFREGTRGALKIVYYSAVEKFSGTVFQKDLEKQLFMGRHRDDFSAFDIFGLVKDGSKDLWVKRGKDESDAGRLSEFKEILESAQKQVLFFSGNLSFINFDDGKTNIFQTIEDLVKRRISIKIICRVDFQGINNIRKILCLNHKYGEELIEIRHRSQPLRATIIDNKLINLKEVKDPTGKVHELEEKTFIFYSIKDKDWIKWLTQIFWRMFNSSIGSQKRIIDLDKISD